MRFKDGWYYAFAGVLVLATVPIYRYIIERGRRPDVPPTAVFRSAPGAAAGYPAITAADLAGTAPLPDLRARVFYRYGEKLPDGYRCSAAGGLVYRRIVMPDGSLGLDPLIRDGVPVRCAEGTATPGSLIK